MAALGLAVCSLWAGGAVAQAPEPSAKLVDFASEAAVFSRNGELMLVRVGERIPGSEGRLSHVGGTDVRVDYVASAQSPGGVLLLSRMAAVPTHWPVTEAKREPVPVVSVIKLPADQAPSARLDSPLPSKGAEENRQ